MTDTLTPARIAIADIPAGFGDPVQDAQAAFRALLDALARPGTIVRLAPTAGDADLARGSSAAPAAFAALLALSDDTTPLFLDTPDAVLASALRFHTGAPLVDAPARACFAYLHAPDAAAALDRFAAGAPDAPEQSATLFVRVDALTGGAPVRLRGPGIDGACDIAPAGLPAAFWTARAAFAPLFPCGIDVFLVCGRELLGLPRTTHAEVD
jgi:alpha-D-ribose 1-methylphosphonate 5-triphosphate synthase subunit PhnH